MVANRHAMQLIGLATQLLYTKCGPLACPLHAKIPKFMLILYLHCKLKSIWNLHWSFVKYQLP
jgi:hypothetical protein